MSFEATIADAIVIRDYLSRHQMSHIFPKAILKSNKDIMIIADSIRSACGCELSRIIHLCNS